MKYAIRTIAIAAAFFAMGLDWFSTGPQSDLDSYWQGERSDSTAVVNHQQWQQLLDDYLVEDHSGINLFDYEGVQESDDVLQGYIESLANIDPRTLNRAEQMSYWINMYNALTVQVVSRNYPIESIKEVGGSLFASGPWDDEVVSVTGRALSLNDIEHRILRPIFNDYRIHFAVNCASIGCPNLASSAYTSENLEVLLTEGAETYLKHDRGVALLEDELRLSSLFKWYGTDFGDSQEEMLETLAKYLDEDLRDQVINFDGDIEFEYDWQLNDLG